jgi:hypothetical protein
MRLISILTTCAINQPIRNLRAETCNKLKSISCTLFSHSCIQNTSLGYGTHSLRGGIKNILNWGHHLYSGSGSAKYRSQKAKLWTPCSTVMFCGDCVKTCENVTPNFGENRPGCFTMTTAHLTLPTSPSSFWRNKKWLSSPTHCTPLTWHSVTSSNF